MDKIITALLFVDGVFLLALLIASLLNTVMLSWSEGTDNNFQDIPKSTRNLMVDFCKFSQFVQSAIILFSAITFILFVIDYLIKR